MRRDDQSTLEPFRCLTAKRNQDIWVLSPVSVLRFCTERWQLVVHMLELYRQYGVDLQVYYLDSILTEILDYINVNAVLHRSVQSLFCRFTCVLTSLE